MDPSAAPVMTGSHMDTQPKGGRFDGIFGVLAGLEALEAMDAAGVRTRAPIEVVAWTNEEGGRFPPCTMGSMVFAGARTVEDFIDVRDNAGIRLGDALAQTLAATPDAARRAAAMPVAAYVEAHIEQGPLLESAALQVGAVTGVQGMRWFNVEVSGESAHAGTAPVSLRRAARSVLAATQSRARTNASHLNHHDQILHSHLDSYEVT
jgi:N-carbamoyl-L-amino-acid hydrolase